MVENLRFLNENDYASCINIILSQKSVIEKRYDEDYRFWITPLSGWLHSKPYEKFKGSFLDLDKKLVGYFYNEELISFAGLICYPRTDVAIYTYRISNKNSVGFESNKVYTEKTKYLFKWAESKGKRNIFSSNHPKISLHSKHITENDEYLKRYNFSVVATYNANEFPINSWHLEIMEFSSYPFKTDITSWSL